MAELIDQAGVGELVEALEKIAAERMKGSQADLLISWARSALSKHAGRATEPQGKGE